MLLSGGFIVTFKVWYVISELLFTWFNDMLQGLAAVPTPWYAEPIGTTYQMARQLQRMQSFLSAPGITRVIKALGRDCSNGWLWYTAHDPWSCVTERALESRTEASRRMLRWRLRKDWFSNLWWLFKVNCLHSLSRESSCQTASFGTPRAVARVRRNRQRKIKLENFFRPLPLNSTYYHLSIVSAFPWNDCNYVKAENQSCSGVSIL